MKVVAYVPVKLNNERFPNKNLQLFSDGTPLPHLVFNTLSSVKEIDEIYCYCSSPIIKNYLTGRIQFLQRPTFLDTAEAKCGDIIAEFVKNVPDADIIVLSHVTSPFLRAETVIKCVQAVKSGKYDSAFTASRVQEFLWSEGKPLNFDPASIVRSQDLPLIYKETIGCFAFTRQMFLENHRRIGLNPFICEVDKIEETDINYLEDFQIANAIYMQNVNSNLVGGGVTLFEFLLPPIFLYEESEVAA